MKKVLLPLFVVIATVSYAQETSTTGTEYQRALGVKISSGIAATFKQFVSSKHALEAQGMFFREGVRFTGLYEFHFYNIEGVNGLAWYVGPGAHIGFYIPKYKTQYNTAADIGIDGVIGLDYKIKNTPINLSLDWQPSYSILGNAGLQPQFGGLSIRYVLQ